MAGLPSKDVGPTVGVAIFARRASMRLFNATITTRGRGLVVSAAIEGCVEPVHFATLYLETGGKVTNGSVGAMASMGNELEKRGGSYLLAGDWQVSPEVLEAGGFPQLLGGVVVAPTPRHGTCATGRLGKTGSVSDYGALPNGLACCLKGVDVCLRTRANPHRPVVFTLVGPCGEGWVKRLPKR